jgi:hypothetical protein
MLVQSSTSRHLIADGCAGKVLFIDEAYRLMDGPFAKEAMDELVDCLTKPEFASRMITILAGYDHHINSLMNMNPGLVRKSMRGTTADV